MVNDMIEFMPKTLLNGNNRSPHRHHKHDDGYDAFGDIKFLLHGVFAFLHVWRYKPRKSKYNTTQVLFRITYRLMNNGKFFFGKL